MTEHIDAGDATTLKPGESRRIEIEGDTVCIHNVGGTFHAISNICPHAGAALHFGFIENGRITCPWHGWSFPLDSECDLRDGLYRYRVHEDEDRLYIETPPVNA